ncbi:MAG: S8 family serine peptidase, partial [Clostridia bacterium]|nr:S8 family serine peptidase [Clostridia bacterium]
MSKKNYRALLSMMLAVFMLLPSVAGMVQAAPQVNEELLQSAEMVSHENRESGMVGFNGEYALDEDEEQVSVIVELQSQPAALVEAIAEVNGEKLNETTAQLEAKAEADMDALIEALEGIDYEITTEYDTAFNGVAVTVPAYAVEMLAHLPNVFAVYPNEVYENVTGADEAEDFIEGMGDSHEYYSDVPSLGLTGKGVTVGIIDTGVDYKHPDLSDSFGSTRPSGEPLDEADLIDGVFYGRNYIEGNGHDVNDPWDDQGHGTHVAGTVTASNHNEGGISALGMAPDATIISYKVINAADSCSLEDVVAAMEDAVEDGCEIISMSLGWSGINDADHGTTTAMNSLALQNEDVLFVVCAGNSGPNNFKVWSPGTSPLALTVANAQIPSADRQLTITRDGETEGDKVGLIRSDWADEVIHNEDGTFGLEALKADENGSYKMVLVPTVDGTKLGTGTFAEYEALIGENTADYEGTLFVVERGVSFDQHVADLHALGLEGAGVVVVNTAARENDFENISWWQGYYQNYMPIFTVQYTPGQALIEGLELKTAYNFKFTDAEPLTTSVANGADLFPSSDTSRGPVSEKFYLKPDLSAPGKAIISTYPAWLAGKEGEYDYAYTAMSGTSMATPHVSGFVALMKEAYPELTALQLKSLLVNTADYMAFGDEISRYAVGNGMIDPVAAFEAAKDMVTITSANQYAYNNDGLDTTVETPVISFGGLTKNFMTEDVTEKVTVTVKNEGTEAHTYALSLYNPTHAYHNDSTNAEDIEGIFSLSAETVTVEAGGTATFDLTAVIPADAEIGSYEVTVVLEEDDAVLSIPAALYITELTPIANNAVNDRWTYLHTSVYSSGEYMQLPGYSE